MAMKHHIRWWQALETAIIEARKGHCTRPGSGSSARMLAWNWMHANFNSNDAKREGDTKKGDKQMNKKMNKNRHLSSRFASFLLKFVYWRLTHVYGS